MYTQCKPKDGSIIGAESGQNDAKSETNFWKECIITQKLKTATLLCYMYMYYNIVKKVLTIKSVHIFIT